MSEPQHELAAPPSVDSLATATADEDLLAVLADDFSARLRRGEQPQVEEYTAKHPALAERIQKVLEAIALMEQSRTVEYAGASERVGDTIGRYKLLERIGEGGFGVVYMAEQQQPVRRKVALKVVKPGMDSRQVLARFEAERQALALMDHPNIAKVFDGGMTDSDRPYFVMELVKGEPITEFCDRNHLTPRERLELFAQVCQAVQHAHTKGIIHRDIKPTNVLVAMHDTNPVVRVIDFGVAKALGQELTDKTLFTGFAQLVGTPLYMSPEQAGQSSLDVDTRSDIYSLGVLLYELLTGTTPFDKERFKRAAHDEICRIIREEEPPTPSTRLSELTTTGTVGRCDSATIAANRQSESAKLTKLVRGELDWIVMKALEKDRTRRYETATGLARDIERYLNDEPVEACPPSTAYRFKKFVRRNKAALATAAIVGVALLCVVGSLSWAARDRAARQAKVAGQVEVILSEVDKLQREHKWPEALAAVKWADAIVTSGEADAETAQQVGQRLKDLEFIDRLGQVRIQGEAAWPGGKFDYSKMARAYARAFREYGVHVEALAVERSIERFRDRSIAIPVAAALDAWAQDRANAKRNATDVKRLVKIARGIDPEPLRDRLRSTWGKPPDEVRDELLQLAESIDIRAHDPATLLRLAQRLDQVERADVAARLRRDAQVVYPGDFWLNFRLGDQLNRTDVEGAARFYSAAVAIRPNMSCARYNLGLTLLHQKKWDEAIAAFRKAIEVDPQHANAYSALGFGLEAQGNVEEAIGATRKALEIDPEDATTRGNLVWYLSTCADLKLRVPSLALIHAKKTIETDPDSSINLNNLGVAYYRNGDYKAAIAALERSLERHRVGHTYGLFFLAMSHWRLGNKIEARNWYNTAIEKMAEHSPDDQYATDEELIRFRAEAAELLGMEEKKESEASSAPAK